MNRIYINLIIGILVVIGLIVFMIWDTKLNLGKTEVEENKTMHLDYQTKQGNRILKFIVLYDFAQTSKVISNKATPEIIEHTMKSIDWEKFHVVYLEDKNGNILDVSGSLYDDGLSSSYVNDDVHLLKVNPPKTVEDMIEILTRFLHSEQQWKDYYTYK